MRPGDFYRSDLIVRVRRAGGRSDEMIEVALLDESSSLQPGWRRFPTPNDARQFLAFLDGAMGFANAMAGWRARPTGGPLPILRRLALQLDDPRLAVGTWEWDAVIAERLWPGEVSVRLSAVRPRFRSRRFTLPMRFVHVDPRPGESSVTDQVASVFAGHPLEAVRPAVEWESCAIGDIGRVQERHPTLDVLHFDGTQWPEDSQGLLSLECWGEPATLGWLLRLATLAQTRLIVLEVKDHREARLLRLLAEGLAARGGPAIVVTAGNTTFFYGQIIHDQPLDSILSTGALQSALDPRPGAVWTLFGGAGREEALRISTLVDQVAQPGVVSDILAVTRPRASPFAVGQMSSGLTEIARLAPFWSYAHEIQGLIPLGALMAQVRAAYRQVVGPPTRGEPARAAAVKPESRSTSCALWRESEGDLQKIKRGENAPSRGETLQLSIQISPLRDPDVIVLDRTDLIEEAFKWEDGKAGVRLQVAVVGIDFDLSGHPVQDLWLPREGATDTVWFTVSPNRAGPCKLRVCVYYGNAVVQTLGLTAWVEESGQITPGEERARQMGRALGTTLTEAAPGPYYLAAEYGDTNDVGVVVERRGPDVSIVANDSEGRAVVAVKVGDDFEVGIDGDLPKLIQGLRAALTDASFKVDPQRPGKLYYRFGNPIDFNQGTEEMVRQGLALMAQKGFQIYQAIFSGATRRRLELALDGPPATIQVAQVILESSIPWSLIYGRTYDADYPGVPAADRVCLAPLRSLVTMCGTHETCPLHPGSQSPLPRQAVACPRYFWGLRHWIEIPIEQYLRPKGAGASDPAQDGTGADHAKRSPSLIACQRPAQVVSALNQSLIRGNLHRENLEEMVQGAIPAATQAVVLERAQILDALEKADPSVIYFLCHAAASRKGAFEPYLDFTSSDGFDQIITAAQLDGEPWRRRPFVILNGCDTVGFTPEALSPFLKTLVRDRQASGVLGTEVPVAPELAMEVGLLFLRHFLEGTSVGEALHNVRWNLLMRNNPLGLVYTLYALSSLALSNEPELGS